MRQTEFKRRPLSPDDVERLVRGATTPDERLAVLTLLDTGLRVSELCAIRDEDLDYQRGRLLVRGKREPGAARPRRRAVFLTGRVRELLSARLTSRAGVELTPRTVQRLVRRAASRGGVRAPCTPHVLRHTFAVLYVLRGGSTRALQELLGHSSLETTEIYLRLSGRDVERDFRRVVDRPLPI